ncbi:MAG: amino acid ABC transporter permease [Clostridia bacterium]|nr:amino acid ABC transporter permease [Clostridia bacterium]
MSRSFFEWVGVILDRYGTLFLAGTGNTMLIAISGTVLGFGLGLLVAVARGIKPAPRARFLSRALLAVLKSLLNIYIEVFRGTPMLVQAMVIYYGIQMFFGIMLHAVVAGVFIVSINTGAYMAEIVRGGILSVDVGQTEAAHSIGMTHWQTMTHVVLPQAIRNIMPALGNEFIVNIKDSCVLNVISVTELFFQARAAAGATLKYFEVFFIIGCIYLTLTFTVSRLLRMLERRMDGPASYTIHGSQSGIPKEAS